MLSFSPTDTQAIELSIQVALTATVLGTPLGFAVSTLLVFGRFRGKTVLDAVINLPLVLPPVVVGYLILLALSEESWLGRGLQALGLPILFTWKGAVLASMTVGFPLLVRSIRLGMEAIDPGLIQASRSLGAPWYDTLLTVILPQSVPSVLAGSSLLFARSLGEFGATIVLAGNIPGVTQTIPLSIFDYTSRPGGDSGALSLCVVSVLLSYAVLFGNECLVRRFRGEGKA